MLSGLHAASQAPTFDLASMWFVSSVTLFFVSLLSLSVAMLEISTECSPTVTMAMGKARPTIMVLNLEFSKERI